MENKSERGAARFREFTNDITSLARKILEDISDEQMKRIFTDCVNAHNAPDRAKSIKDEKLKKIREFLVEKPLPYIKGDLEEAFADLNINAKLQLLVELQDKYKDRNTPAWRPPSEPQQHMKALRVAAKRDLLEKLQILVSMKRQQVDHLKEQFKDKKTSIDLVRGAALIHDVKGKLDSIHDLNRQFNESHEQKVEQIAHEVAAKQQQIAHEVAAKQQQITHEKNTGVLTYE